MASDGKQKHGEHVHDPDHDPANLFAISAFSFQVIILIIFAAKFDYADATANQTAVTDLYPMFQDVHVMIFVGFGFLMTFLRKYGYSSVGLNMLVAALTMQWMMTVGTLMEQAMAGHANEKVFLTPVSLVKGDFAAGAVLISFGAVLGRVTPTQLIWMAMLEILFYTTNEFIGVHEFKAIDMGGSMFVHTFGAYFGLGVSYMLGTHEETHGEHAGEEETNSYHSDLFSMIGTIFLWMFWPSFNGALTMTTGAGSRHRVIINTVLGIAGSCVAAFAMSKWLSEHNKFEMEHIQNATLAGGVAVGSSSDLVIGPFGAVLIGIIAGILSTLGYVYCTKFCEENFNVSDTCGVHNLHGMPGILGGICGAISAGTASTKAYGVNIGEIFPKRAVGGSASDQAVSQILTLLVTLVFSIVGGLATGYVISHFPGVKRPYQDADHWDVPADYAYTGEERRPLVGAKDNIEIEMGDDVAQNPVD